MKNVLHLLRSHSQSNAPFIKNQILYHINFQPTLVSRFQSQCNSKISKEYLQESIKFYSLDSPQLSVYRKFFNYRHLSTNEIKKLIRLIKEENISILHFHFGNDALIYYPLLKHIKLPSVVSFYGYDSSKFPKSRWGLGRRYLQKYLFPYVSKVLVMSLDMKEDLIQIGCPVKKIIVHYHGAEVRKFYIKRDFYTKKNGIVNFLIISRLVPKKGHLFLLEAFKKAYAYDDRIRLIICGKGPYYNRISSFIKVNKMHYVSLKKKVKYASREHLFFLKNADIFIHPSVNAHWDKEGIPGTIVEAMSAGLPIISTFHAGIPYIINNNKTGLLVDPWDVDSLTNSILKLANRSGLRKKIGLNGQKYALMNLGIVEKEKELEYLYDSIIDLSRGS